MAADTLIEWARHPVTGKGATWNIVTGCDIVSPGCTNCYAMKLAGNRLKNIPSRKGLTRDTKAGPVWTGETRFNEEWLTQPLKWKTGRGIFVAAHGDLFARGVTDAQLDRIFAVMALCPQHVFMVLTKRPERMREYFSATDIEFRWKSAISLLSANSWDEVFAYVPLPNVWLGVSVEDQPRADERIPILLDTPAAIRFISAEPLLGPIDFNKVSAAMPMEGHPWRNGPILQGIDWIIAGGESGNKARPSHPDWFRALRDQCAAAEVAFFFKQWGSWIVASEENGHHDSAMASNDAFWIDAETGEKKKPSCDGMANPIGMFRVTKKRAGRHLDGVTHDAFPQPNSALVGASGAVAEGQKSTKSISTNEGLSATPCEGKPGRAEGGAKP